MARQISPIRRNFNAVQSRPRGMGSLTTTKHHLTSVMTAEQDKHGSEAVSQFSFLLDTALYKPRFTHAFVFMSIEFFKLYIKYIFNLWTQVLPREFPQTNIGSQDIC